MPTEQLFGAYSGLLTIQGATAQRHILSILNGSGMKISPVGLGQALKGQLVTNQNDRQTIAKLLFLVSEVPSSNLSTAMKKLG